MLSRHCNALNLSELLTKKPICQQCQGIASGIADQIASKIAGDRHPPEKNC
jgi:hypothetical protein